MKSNDPQATPPPAADPQPAHKEQSPLLRYDYREHEFEHWLRPSELELAQLAAQLASGGQMEAKQAVQMAWEVYWESCQLIRADHRHVAAYFAREAEMKRDLNYPALEAEGAVPMPKAFPISHQQVEALLLPKLKGRTAERAALIREFLFSRLARTCLVVRPKLAAVSYWEVEADLLEQLRQSMKDEVAQHYEKFRKTVFDVDAYRRFAAVFLEWHRRFILAKKSAAARQRWAKADEKQKEAVSKVATKVATHSKNRRKNLLVVVDWRKMVRCMSGAVLCIGPFIENRSLHPRGLIPSRFAFGGVVFCIGGGKRGQFLRLVLVQAHAEQIPFNGAARLPRRAAGNSHPRLSESPALARNVAGLV